MNNEQLTEKEKTELRIKLIQWVIDLNMESDKRKMGADRSDLFIKLTDKVAKWHTQRVALAKQEAYEEVLDLENAMGTIDANDVRTKQSKSGGGKAE